MLAGRKAGDTGADLTVFEKSASDSSRFIVTVFDTHDRIRPSIRELVFDRRRDGLDELLRPGPAAIPIPIELRANRERPRPADVPLYDDVPAHDKSPWASNPSSNIFRPNIERCGDRHIVTFPFHDVIPVQAPEL